MSWCLGVIASRAWVAGVVQCSSMNQALGFTLGAVGVPVARAGSRGSQGALREVVEYKANARGVLPDSRHRGTVIRELSPAQRPREVHD